MNDFRLSEPKNYFTCTAQTKNILMELGITEKQLQYNYLDVIEDLESDRVFPYGMFLMGTAIKYLWNAGKYSDLISDLQLAITYIERYRLSYIRRNMLQRFILGNGGRSIGKLIKSVLMINSLILELKAEKQQIEESAKEEVYHPFGDLPHGDLYAWGVPSTDDQPERIDEIKVYRLEDLSKNIDFYRIEDDLSPELEEYENPPGGIVDPRSIGAYD